MSEDALPPGPPPEPVTPSSDEPNRITNLPPPDPNEPVLTKSMFDAHPVAPILEAPPLVVVPGVDLRSELFEDETLANDARAVVEGSATPVLTADVVAHVEQLSPEAATAMVIGPSPDKSKIQPDATPLHRTTKPAQTVQEAAEKAKTSALPGHNAADRVSQEDAKKLVEAEIKRVAERYAFVEGLTKELNATINPLQARDFQSFVRSHLAHVVGFYVVTGQPVNELRTEATSEQLAAEEAKLVEGLDPALARNPAALEALRMGWKPGDTAGDIG